jgi:hypothetical protein
MMEMKLYLELVFHALENGAIGTAQNSLIGALNKEIKS